METATATVYLDPRKNKDKLRSVKIRVYFNRDRRYYSTGINVKDRNELDHALNGKRRTQDEKTIDTTITHFKSKADKIIKTLPVFTFEAFEERYLDNRKITTDVYSAFDKYITELKEDGSLGTAELYECAKNSLHKFQPKLTFAGVNVKFLKSYEKWMLKKKLSNATIGIYLRNLRTIYNQQNIDKSVYPFGDKKYTIPTGRNLKKALTVAEIAKIYQYEAEPNTNEEMARDYWIFMYLCNGMNTKDLCLLKWENIQGDVLIYQRAKTKKSEIQVSLKAEALKIINKWGVRSLSKDSYVFPHLTPEMDAITQRKVYQQLTAVMNKYTKRIAKAVGINREVTTYYARHSFATVLQRSGSDVTMISKLLGHSSLAVTENYLAGFEKEQLQKETDVLTEGFKTKIS